MMLLYRIIVLCLGGVATVVVVLSQRYNLPRRSIHICALLTSLPTVVLSDQFFMLLMSAFCVISSRSLVNLTFRLLNNALMSCYTVWLSGNAYLCDILGDPVAASRGQRKWRFRRAISSAPQLSAVGSPRVPLWQHCALLMVIWKK